MNKKRDLAGQRFGRLIALYDTGERKDRKAVWHCRCDCGTEVDVIGRNLTGGHTTSCGCYNRERTVEAHTVHGMARHGKQHSVYWIWRAMCQRCENQDHKYYKNYGGRGITVCDEWHDPQVFINWALASGWERGLSIDRIDNNGNYEPGNCRWVTWKEQARNKRNNHLITFDNKTQPLAQWAEGLNIPVNTLRSRINQLHWPIERALTEPSHGKK